MTKINTMSMVVRPKNRKSQQKKKKGGRKTRALTLARTRGNPRRMDSEKQHFYRALVNPFSPEAVGARVCDAFPMPTATYHLRGSLSATTTTAGDFKIVILPSPCLTYILGDGTFGTVTGGTSFTQNPKAGYLATPSTISNILAEYRVVAWGIRLIAKDTAFNAKGKIAIAVVPTTNNAPSWNTCETITATNTTVIAEYCCGLDLSGYSGPNSILGLPGVQVYSAQDLLHGEVRVNGLPSHVEFYAFKGTADRTNHPWASGIYLADEVVTSATSLVNATAAGRKDISSLRGGSAIVIWAAGMPASSQEFDIELVYHLEGVPNTGSSTGAQLVPSSTKSIFGDTVSVEKLLATARTAVPLISRVASSIIGHGAAFARGALPGATRPVGFLM